MGAKGIVITQSPCRISFLGGGSDLPEYFGSRSGDVIGAAIDKYVYVTVNSLERLLEKRILLSYSKLEKVDSPAELEHEIVRAVLQRQSYVDDGGFLDIHTYADLPSSSGVGSSSAFTVGLLQALYFLGGVFRTPYEVACEAIHIEREVLKHAGGWQDQIFSAYGGLSRIRFRGTEFTVEPVSLPTEKTEALQRSCMLFFSNTVRRSSDIHERIKAMPVDERHHRTGAIAALAAEGYEILVRSRDSQEMVVEFGRLLGKSWDIKRQIAPEVTTDQIDALYSDALDAGAAGGKLCGAGGGGFFLVVVPEEARTRVLAALSRFTVIGVRFDTRGSAPLFARHV